MKKLICLLLLSATLLTSLSSCANNGNNNSGDSAQSTDGTSDTGDHGNPDDQTPSDDGAALDSRSLQEIFEAIKVPDTEYPSLMELPIEDDETFETYFGLSKRPDGLSQSLVIVPNISSIPLMIGLLRMEDGVDAGALAKEIEDALDTHQWICAQPSFVKTAAKGNVVLLVVEGDDARGQAMLDAFKAI